MLAATRTERGTAVMSAGLVFVTGLFTFAGCTCSRQGLEGAADVSSEEDAPLDVVDISDSDSGEVGDIIEDDIDDEEVTACPDRDGDGHSDSTCGGDDCDDTDPGIYPGAEEVCADGIDQDCDGIVDGLTTVWTSDRLEGSTSRSLVGFLFWSGSEYLLGWSLSEYSPWHIDRISASGDIIEHNRILPGITLQPNLVAAWTGSSVGLTWINGLYGSSARMMFSFISMEGTGLMDPVAVVEDELLRIHQAMAWTGSEMHIVWKSSAAGIEDIVLTRVDEAGLRTDADLRLSSGDDTTYEPPSLAWTGSKLGVAWSSRENFGLWEWDHWEVLFKVYDSETGELGDLVNISYHEGASEHPHMLWTGSELTTAWKDRRFSDSDAFFIRMDDTGISLMEEVRLEAAGDWIGEPIRHVWTGSEFVVGWTEMSWGIEEISLFRVDAFGVPVGDLVRTESVEWNCFIKDMVWTGSEIGIVMRDGMYENEGLYFTRIGYCE